MRVCICAVRGAVSVPEHEGLVLPGEGLENGVDLGREAHVEHAVSLVQHAVGHLRQRHVATAHEVRQTAGRGNDNAGATGNLLNLVLREG